MSTDIDQLVDPIHLKLMRAIVEAKSFSGAAARLGITQPSVSQQVKRLEKLTGRTLFRRTRTGVEPTTDGETLVIYAQAILGLTDDLRRQFRRTEGTVKLSLGMAEDFCRTALPSVMRLFMRDHPKIEMRILCGSVETLMAAVETKTVDLAVMRRHPAYPDVQSLLTDDLVWAGRSDLQMPIADPVPLVLPAAPHPMREIIMDALRREGRTWRVPFESTSFVSIESGLRAGLGIGAIPRNLPRFDLALLEDAGLPDLPKVEYVMAAPDHHVDGAVAAFAEILRVCAGSSFRLGDVEAATSPSSG